MSQQSLNIGDKHMSTLREAALRSSRTVTRQAEFWLELGCALETHPAFKKIVLELVSQDKLQPSHLPMRERSEFFTAFMEKVGQPTQQEEEFFAERRARGVGVGADANGNLVRALPDGRSEPLEPRKR